MNRRLNLVHAIASICFLALYGQHSSAADPPPGDLKLLDSYTHKKLQGFDSLPGVISKPGGLQIYYEIGAIPKPGAPQFGSQFTDKAKNTPAKQRQWYKEQIIAGQPVHLAYTNTGVLIASFPKSGINFRVDVKSDEDLAEALLTILSYPSAAKNK